MKSIIYLFLFAFVLLDFTAAQPYSIKRLDLEQGLSNNYVVSITQDKSGFMWFATESGLNRFDGKEFRVYKKYFQNSSGIIANELNKVLADKTDNIVWIGSQRSGLNMLDCETDSFSLFINDPANNKSIISNEVTDLVNDEEGNLWISTYTSGIDYYDKKKKEFIHYNQSTVPGLKSNQVWSIAENKKGKLYIGHVSTGLSILSIKDRSVKNFVHETGNPYSLPDNDIRCIFIDNLENVWIGTKNGLALFNPESGRFTCFYHNKDKSGSLISNTVFAINQTKDNKLWIGTENGGISILDMRKEMFLSPENISFHNIYPSDDETGLSYSTVRAIYEDSFNNVWIGTYSGGINFISYKPDFFHKWQYAIPPLKNSLSAKVAWGICEDNQGNIWIGTDGGGIQVFKDNLRIKNYTTENGNLNSNAILSALKDSEGNLWFGSFNDGICIYENNGSRFKIFNHAGFSARTVRYLYEDDKKTIWIGTDDKGMYSYNLQTKNLNRYTSENYGLPKDNLIRAISQDKKGRLWVGSFGEGLGILDSNFQSVISFNTSHGFYSNTINYIFRDSQNRMWVGTGEGIVLFPDDDHIDNYIIYTEKDGLRDSHIRAITEDKNGNIWISTNDGISKFEVRENKFYNYNQFNGVPSGQFMSGSVINSTNGILYFGSQNGVCYFNPNHITGVDNLPPVTITGFRYYVNDKHGLTTRKDVEKTYPVFSHQIQLKYNQNTFTITFNVMDYAFSHQAEYAYQLNGIDNGWYNIGQKNEVSFRNLPPGNYVFSVKSRINDQDWSDEIASLQIKINPPIWFTWWAKLFYILVSVFITWFIVRFYKKRIKLENLLFLEKQNNLQQKALNDEKLQFFTNIAHELRTPLTLIVGPLEDLSKEPSLSTSAEKKVSLIKQNTSRLLDLINRILDFRKTETNNMPLRVIKGDLSKLVKEVGLKYKELNRNEHILFTTSIETEHTILYYDPENVHIILDNLISNAFKYTTKGEIKICMRNVTAENILYTELEVQDTGYGIPKEALDKVFNRYYQVQGTDQVSGTGIGLSLVKNLATLHQGLISVESEPGKGTSFKFRLLTNNTYPDAFHEKGNEEKSYPFESAYPFEIEVLDNGKGIMLIIEDNADIRNYIWDTFADEYSVLMAENGKTGLENAFNNIPDIIISDIMMPEMSGLELCSALKKDIRTSHIPIILLTAKSSLEDKTEGYSAGADSYITKPFSANLLKSRVSNLIEARKKLITQIPDSKIYKQAILADSISKLDKEFLEKITKIIEDNSHLEKMDIEFIAQLVHMSHSTLYRKIKALTGYSINEFIRKIKIKHAEELLLTGKYTISEIAFRVGINSITYFRQCFKDEFGLPPSEYLKKLNS